MHWLASGRGGIRPIHFFILCTGLAAPLALGQELPRPQRWEQQIQAFEAQDRTRPPAKGGILFVGSSSIRLWDVAKSFPTLPVLNRGFGGSFLSDTVHFADRIIVPYEPRLIVVYAGDNDLAAGKSPDVVFADFKALAQIVEKALPKTRLVFLSIKPSPKRWSLSTKAKQANQLIADFVRQHDRLTFVDVSTPMLGADGKPRAELFRADNLHLNATGYQLWASLLKPLLDKSSAAPAAKNRSADFDTVVSTALKQGPTASYAVAVVRDGRLVCARGYGYADLEHEVPATAETVYRLGSITKQFTAMAILQLVAQHKLALDDALTKHLPDFPAQGKKVTIHHLLNHTSGIHSYTSMPAFWKRMRDDLSHQELLALFAKEPFDFAPGERWQYSNSGYYLLGMVIEKVSGQRYAEYLEEHIFRPLYMDATRYDDPRALIRHRAHGYARRNGRFVNADYISMNMPGAAGALVSNVLDLVKWAQALEAGQFLPPQLYDAMVRPTTLANGQTQAYGYGWGLSEFRGHRKIAHGGGINGFNTEIARYPDDRLAIIVLANTEGSNPERLERQLAEQVLGVEAKTALRTSRDMPRFLGDQMLQRTIGLHRNGFADWPEVMATK